VALNFTNPFINRNGDVVNYSVIVVETDRNSLQLKQDITESWYTAYKQNPSPPYAAIYKCQDMFGKSPGCADTAVTENSRNRSTGSVDYAMVVIGGDASCEPDIVIAGTYCNGPLKQNTRYMVFLRGYNEENEFVDAAGVAFFTGNS